MTSSGHELRIGARFPNSGPVPAELGLANVARRLEGAGFDSLWTSDHLAMPVASRSAYPFSGDGTIPWPVDRGWSEAVVSLAIAAAATERIELGTAVLVAALRHPLVTAMQLATISLEAGGRLALGIGAGWLAEEFEAVGVPFAKRGARLDAWMDVVRSVWSGVLPARGDDGFYPNPTEMVCRPVPPHPVPILLGGLSPAALRRVGTRGDGWVALQPADALDPGALAGPIATIRRHMREAGRDDATVRITLQITGSRGRADEIAGRVADLEAAGVHEIIVDIDWDDPDGPEAAYEPLRSATRRSG